MKGRRTARRRALLIQHKECNNDFHRHLLPGRGHPRDRAFRSAPDHTFAVVKLAIIEKHGLDEETLIYLEDRDEPIDEQCLVRDHVGRAGIKVASAPLPPRRGRATFNGETVHHKFGPGTTVARVKNWAAEHKFGMTPQEAGEHVLQISGTKDRPIPARISVASRTGRTAASPSTSSLTSVSTALCRRGREVRTPDERAFRTDIGKPAFRLAEAEGRWRLAAIAWPFVLIAVVAADDRP